ncbi:hypothetical protein E4S40_02940 [Algoriphagus kandeliae]|uniref:Uncharacterized protein n=1 Tax=Algoriphagus kandeliae TaxID=2562278 RepID=A0A4Y9QYM3_9BACT|nr:hypothetical protein [Algoriphagus kandeliae]TFV97621.1 hypothetical protein E4S40_02940 [Algoriphagus kandeliae]
MKIKFFQILILSAAIMWLGTSCNSDDDDPQQQTQANPIPTPGDADGILAAIKAKSNLPSGTPSVPGISDILLDVANANFYSSSGGSSSLVNVGEVSLNDFPLQNLNNTYVNDFTDVTLGINSGQNNDWVVAGANGFDGFTHTTGKVMPGVVRFSASIPDEISIGGDVSLSIESVPSNVDNILWVISDGDKVVTKEARSTSITFSSSELSGLRSTSQGIVQVAAYNTESRTVGGKKIYFINETVDSKFVSLN